MYPSDLAVFFQMFLPFSLIKNTGHCNVPEDGHQ
jgi:hypothetical protein